MSLNRIKKLLSNTPDISILDNISNDKLDKPYLVNAIFRVLDDDSLYQQVLTDEKVLQLFRLCKEYFDKCFSCFLDQSVGGTRLDLLLPYATTTIYKTDAPDGYRVSTVNEVKNGIEQLIPEVTYNITEDNVKYLNLLLWTMTGKIRYYKAAGLECTFTDGRLDDTELRLIYRAGNLLREMIDWMANTSDFERAIATLKLAKKHKYSYPNYARDEVKTDTPFKQAVFICKQSLFVRNLTPEQLEVRKVIYKIDKQGYKPLPHEMASIRRLARRIQANEETNLLVDDLPIELKEICDKFDIAEQKGYISSNEFVFKILASVRKYKKCSPKQMAVINEAEQKIAKKMKALEKSEDIPTKEETANENANEMLAMYDALGSDLFGAGAESNSDGSNTGEGSQDDDTGDGLMPSGVLEI